MKLVINVENGSAWGQCGHTDLLNDPFLFGKASTYNQGIILEFYGWFPPLRLARTLLPAQPLVGADLAIPAQCPHIPR
jgi:hypothetical protein